MYPQDIRLLAHEIIYILMFTGKLNLSVLIPRLHFATSNEYDVCILEHREFLLTLYSKEVVMDVLPPGTDDIVFLSNITTSS